MVSLHVCFFSCYPLWGGLEFLTRVHYVLLFLTNGSSKGWCVRVETFDIVQWVPPVHELVFVDGFYLVSKTIYDMRGGNYLV